MTSTLSICRVELSKQLGDLWEGTTTGAGTTTSLVDTALMAKENDWITDNTFAIITKSGHGAENQERKVTALDNTGGTCTCLAFGTATGTATTYEIHRVFTPSEKRIALVYGARAGFPHIHEDIRDESLVSGNWLKDGSFEAWNSAGTALTYWTASAVTTTKTTSSPYYKHGATSCAISGTAGYVGESISNWDDLKYLAGKRVTFSVQGWCNTASCLRIGILYDGTNVEYSDYHSDTSAWTENNDPLEVEATIDDHPTNISFRIYHDVAAGTSYVDDARVISSSSDRPRIFIGNLGLAQNQPHQVKIEPNNYSNEEDWTLIHNIKYDRENGYMYLPDSVDSDYRLRVLGIGYLDFLASGVSSTAWTSTININSPQTDILMAEAALYLYKIMALPNWVAGEREAFIQMMAYWENELRRRRALFGMETPPATTNWG